MTFGSVCNILFKEEIGEIMSKNIKNLIILTFKLVLYSLLFTVFFGLFSMRNIGLRHLSRTMVITKMTFIIVGFGMLAIYGNFKIGEQKSKPIFYSMALAVFMTDVLTYIQLMIMNTNPYNNIVFQIQDLDLLLYVFLIQLLILWIFAHLGNHLYFMLFKAADTVLVYENKTTSVEKVLFMISRFKLQYKLIACMNIHDDDLEEKIQRADYIILMDMSSEYRNTLVELCYKYGINFSYQPDLSSIVEFSGNNVVYDDVPMVEVNLEGLSVEEQILKRILDILVSLLGLIITFPIFIIVAIAIKIDDGGKVFFKQKRYTKDHQIFEVLKFRSMKENVENYSVVANDDRITKVGKIIRKTRLDELPQLINILKGDMSLVGPRPEMLENVHKYESDLPEFAYRLKVKGGLTGIAQIEGKYNTSPKDKLHMDLVYIENYSFWNDLKILFRTLIVLFKKDSTEAFEGTDN